MKRLAYFLLSAMMLGIAAASFPVNAEETHAATRSAGGQINWMTNYDQAVKQSQATSKPIVLFFTGTGWCGWCSKLENEALSTPEFINATKDKFIFVKLDFPINPNAQDAATKDQNQNLQKKFAVKGFPTIVVLNSNQQQIGSTGYVAGGGKNFADHLLKIANK